jgi:hypothetical protein
MLGPYADWLTAAAAIWLAGSLIALILAWRDRKTAAVLALATASFIAGLGVLLGHENLSRSNSAYHIALQVKPQLSAGVPLYSVRMYDQTLTFYLQRTVTLVEYQDEMAFGIGLEPGKWIPTLDEFKRRWTEDRDAFALLEPAEFDTLRGELPMTVVARDTRRVIVRKARP